MIFHLKTFSHQLVKKRSLLIISIRIYIKPPLIRSLKPIRKIGSAKQGKENNISVSAAVYSTQSQKSHMAVLLLSSLLTNSIEFISIR